jgi:hypothetical protein
MVEVEKKKFWKSKIFWVNVIALGSLIIRSHFGFVVSAEEEIAILAIINIVLRAITKTGLEL